MATPAQLNKTITVCPNHKLRCPRCSALVARTTIDGGFIFSVCDGKLGTERCNAHLFIVWADFVRGEDDHAVVAVVGAEERQQIRDLARELRRKTA